MKPFAHLKYAALSDVGKKRKNNEDAFGMFPESGIFCVADGMGGGDDGEIASAAVVRTVEDFAARMKPDESGGVCADDVGAGLAVALSTVSVWICNRARVRKLNGCGSTFVGVAFDPTNPAQALAVHAGDSRLYLLHGHSIRQVTRDHSVAELMGEKDESKVNPMFRSMVVNGIGIRDRVEPEFTPFKVAHGDYVLMCSDGLSRMVPDKRIASVVRDEKSPDKAVAALIAAALDAGGVDNVTAVLVQVGELPPTIPRRAPLPPPNPPEEADTEDGDGTTVSGNTGKTYETRTCATMPPGIAEEEAFGGETTKTEDESAAERFSTHRPPRRALWLVLVGLLAAVVCGTALFFALRRRGDGSAPVVRESHDPAPSPVQVERPPATVVAPAPVVVPAPVVAPAPVEAAVRQHGDATRPAGNATVPAANMPARQAEMPAPPATPKSPVVADFVSACSEDSVRAFVRTLKRLLPHDDRTADFVEESERFLDRARKLALTRGAREAEAAAVDLRVLLLNAEAARSALVLRNADAAAKSALSAWDDVLKGDPADASTQLSCASLVRAFKELRL